jgi:hypothetical protein
MKFWSADDCQASSYDKGTRSGSYSKLRSSNGGLLNNWIDNALLKLRKLNWEKWINEGDKFCVRYGSYLLLLVGALSLFGFLINGIRVHNGSFVSLGVAIAVMSILLSWIGFKIINVFHQGFILHNRNYCSREIMDCCFIGFLFIDVILVILLVVSLSISPFLVFVLIFIFTCHAIGALKPQIINIETIDESSPAQELIGLLIFPIKILVKITPFIWFGATLAIAVIMLVYLFSPYAVSSIFQMQMLHIPFHIIAFFSILLIGLFPLIVYFYVLGSCFLLDIISAILCIPKILKVVERTRGIDPTA